MDNTAAQLIALEATNAQFSTELSQAKSLIAELYRTANDPRYTYLDLETLINQLYLWSKQQSHN